MENLSPIERARNVARNLRPSGVYSYIDRMKMWLPERLASGERYWLEEQCKKAQTPCYPKRWDGQRYQQFVDLTQPTDEALRMLSTKAGALLNYLEIALDHVYDSEAEREQAREFGNHYSYKRWHRDSQGIRFVNGVTRYTAKRSAASNLVSYSDRPSRSTGELFCVHTEWRLTGVRALTAAGFNSVQELSQLDYHAFWKQRLLMRAIEPEKLGRNYRVHIENKRGRGSREVDSRTGMRIIRMLRSSQAVVDKYRKQFNLGQCLVELEVEQLLPEKRQQARLQNSAEVPAENLAVGGVEWR